MQTTRQHHIIGLQQDHSQAHIHHCTLSVADELALIDYICRIYATAHPPPPYTVNQVACKLLKSCISLNSTSVNSPGPQLGDHWVQRFKRRHPIVNSVFSHAMETTRLQATDPAKRAGRWFVSPSPYLPPRHQTKTPRLITPQTSDRVVNVSTTQIALPCNSTKLCASRRTSWAIFLASRISSPL